MKNCLGGLFRFVISVVVLVIVAAVVAYYYYSPQLEETLADSVRREFMLPPSSKVLITQGSMLDTMEGEVERLYVESAEAKIDGLVVRDLTLLGEGIHINVLQTIITGQAVFNKITHSEVNLQVSEEELENRWRGELQKKGLSNVQVTLDDEITISAIVDLKVTQVPVSAQGILEVEDGQRILLTVTDLNLSGAEIGLRELEATFSAMTPVIDLGAMKLNIVIDKIRIGDGMLAISARSRSLEDKIGDDQKLAKREQDEATVSDATEEDLLEQISGLMKVDGDERKEQALVVVEKLKEQGIETGGQLTEFVGEKLASFQDEYQVVLKELNKLIESQITDGESEDSEEEGEEEETGDDSEDEASE